MNPFHELAPSTYSPGDFNSYKNQYDGFFPKILKREDTINSMEQQYSNLIEDGIFFDLKNLLDFLPNFTKNFRELFDFQLDEKERWKLVNTSLCNKYFSMSKLMSFSEEENIRMNLHTRPINYVVFAGDYDLLVKMANFLHTSAFESRLENGYNLLHCLMDGQWQNIDNIESCASFLLNKNKKMLSERDRKGLTPLDLGIDILSKLNEDKRVLYNDLQLINHAIIRINYYSRENFSTPQSSINNLLLTQGNINTQLTNIQVQIDGLATILNFLEQTKRNLAKEEKQISSPTDKITNPLSKTF
ncbi:MAG: hypothetical protein H0U49_11180 [Parachlamydiaceae bacterium]|nr:hypothetical protein [Parachlamydiaceae bacterium]